jgi:hypothetical protein
MSEKRISADGTFLLCALLLTVLSRVGLVQSLYDNFNALNVSKDKWIGGEGASQLGRDARVQLKNL